MADFHGFGKERPKLSFLDIIAKCHYYPSISREIVGFCAEIKYYMSDSIEQAWIISMLGMPEMTTPSGSTFNNFRVFINAVNGNNLIGFFSIGYPPADEENIGE